MPVVRVNRQIENAPLPGARKQAAETAISSGAGAALARGQLGNSLSNLGGTVAAVSHKIIEEEHERADTVAILEAQNKLDTWKRKRLYGDAETGEAGALSVQGKDSLHLPETVVGEFEAQSSAIEASLNTPRQREMYAKLKLDRGADLDMTLRRHTFTQMEQLEMKEMEFGVRNSVDMGIRNAEDPPAIAKNIGEALSIIDVHGKNTGMGAEEIKAKKRDVTSTVHQGVINQLLALDKDTKAKAYFEKVKDEINGDAQAKLKTSLEEGTLRGESQRQADDILTKHATFTEQRAAAREIDDPKLRDAVEQRIEHDYNIRKTEEREATEQRSMQAFDILDRTPNVARIPPSLWTSFTGAQRASLIAYAEHKIKKTPVETDLPTWYGLMNKAIETPDKFIETNLLNYRHVLGESEFKQLAGIRASIIAGNREAANKGGLGEFLTHKEIVDSTLQSYGITPSGKDQTPEQLQQTILFQRQLAESVAEEAARTSKKPDGKWIQLEADRILSSQITVPTSGWFGGTNYSSKRAVDFTIRDVPTDEKKRIEGGLQLRGLPVSDQTVLDYYLRARMPHLHRGQQ